MNANRRCLLPHTTELWKLSKDESFGCCCSPFECCFLHFYPTMNAILFFNLLCCRCCCPLPILSLLLFFARIVLLQLSFTTSSSRSIAMPCCFISVLSICCHGCCFSQLAKLLLLQLRCSVYAFE